MKITAIVLSDVQNLHCSFGMCTPTREVVQKDLYDFCCGKTIPHLPCNNCKFIILMFFFSQNTWTINKCINNYECSRKQVVTVHVILPNPGVYTFSTGRLWNLDNKYKKIMLVLPEWSPDCSGPSKTITGCFF